MSTSSSGSSPSQRPRLLETVGPLRHLGRQCDGSPHRPALTSTERSVLVSWRDGNTLHISALPVADITQAAALTAAATGAVAAAAGLVNLRLAILRQRPGLTVFAREWRAGPQGAEHYIEVVTTNVAQRPISVVSMGLELQADARLWRVSDGTASRDLPAKLEDGETMTMTWLRDELGQEFYEGVARIARCFAIDGRGKDVLAPGPGVRSRRSIPSS
jgi:hypothetical protein